MTSDLQSRKKIQSLIKGWLTELESTDGWHSVPPELYNKIRRGMIRLAWAAYKIGLFTPFEHVEGDTTE